MLDFLFPKECLVCTKTGLWLCKTCQKNLQATLPNCYICKKLSNDFKTHKECTKENTLSKVITLWKYNECSRKLVHNFKYKHRFRVANFLYCLFEKKLENINFENSLVIPLPSHNKKIRERGFNPPQVICDLISQKFEINVNSKIVFKERENFSQAKLTYEKRESNVKNAYSIKKEEVKKIEKYTRIIIIDDILTTGATIGEVAKVIKKSCDKEVDITGLCIFQGSFK